MSYIPLGLFALLIVAADQISKYFVVERIAYGSTVPFLEGVLHLTYVQNYGAAFSFLQGHRWLFIVVFVVFVACSSGDCTKRFCPLPGLSCGAWPPFWAAAWGIFWTGLPGLCGGYDCHRFYPVPSVQRSRLLHHLRRHWAVHPSDIF